MTRVYFDEVRGTVKAYSGTGKKHVIWGDWFDVDPHPDDPEKYLINWKVWNAKDRRVGTEQYVIERDRCRDTALLEMIFLDVGQGDGCILSVPDEDKQRTILIDAGQRGNMHGFLNWRFRYVDEGADFDAAVITHPDADHYAGFQRIFDDERIRFGRVFHNGLVERVAEDDDGRIGAMQDGYCPIVASPAELRQLLEDPAKRGRMLYPKLLWTALEQPSRFGDVAMASVAHGTIAAGRAYLPGYAPGDLAGTTIEILGPVPEDAGGGSTGLRAFGDLPGDGKFDVGKTKNGHSIILRLRHGAFTAIFGGDLNRPAEDYLLRHYGGIGAGRPLRDAVPAAGERLGADLLKCCHHGSADVTDEFLEAVHPFAFVVSSGDEESHVHPRPEVLGLLGKKGRGNRPLILCTEILRSTPEGKQLSRADKARLERLNQELDDATDADARKKIRRKITDLWNRHIARLVNVYGAINIRTDGSRLIVAFRKEKSGRGSPWQLYEYQHVGGSWAPAGEDGGGH